MGKEMIRRVRSRYWLWTIALLLALTATWANSTVKAEGGPVVRAVYFYANDCPHCITVIEEVLEPLQVQYDGQLQIKMIEISDPTNYEMLIHAEEMFDVAPEERGIPMLVVDGQVLIGEEAIRQQFPCLLDTCLGTGGTSWPGIPGLESVPVEGGEEPSQDLSPALEGLAPCDSEDALVCEELPPIWVAYFYQVGCKNCSMAEADIQYVRSRHPQLVVEAFNIYESLDLAQCLAERAGREGDLHTPAVFIGDHALIGQGEITPQSLEALVERYAPTGADKIWEECGRRQVNLPEVMAVAVAGLVDGLNPCAFATLIFFVSYLTFTGRKGSVILAVGSAFTLGVFLTYTLVGVGLWRLLSSLPFLTRLGRWVIGLTGLLCALLAILSIRDYLKARRGEIRDMALVMPESLRQRARAVIRRTSSARAFAFLALPTGAIISLLELACTGQVYLPTIVFVISVSGLQAQAVLLLLLYNLMFILPLVIVFVLVYFGTTSLQLGLFLHSHAATVKLGTALLFAALAAWLIISAIV